MKPIDPPMPDLSTPITHKNPNSPIEVSIKIFLAIAGTILLVLGGIYAYTLLMENQIRPSEYESFKYLPTSQTPTKTLITPPASDTEMANWFTHRNEFYGFELKLPPDLDDEFTGKNNEDIFNKLNSNNEKEGRALIILIRPTKETDICKGAGTDFMGECKTLNGHKALYMGSDSSEEEWRDSYSLIYKGSEISLSFYKLLDIETENQILSTFKFTQ